ncbi:MAG: chorismate-binding protein [Bacteroidetes bacterium]|nr:chorismate-binding protein [Bacteroidota bacterium]
MKLHTLTHQILADTKTPVALYLALRDQYQYALLLESSDYNSKNGHYSYICLNPLASIVLKNNILKTTINGNTTKTTIPYEKDVLLNELITFKNNFEYETQPLPFCHAGLFGYTGYDIVNYAEDITLKSDHKTLHIPELIYHAYSIILVFNHTTNSLYIISHHYTKEQAGNQLHEVSEKIQLSSINEFAFSTINETTSSVTDEQYKKLVTKAKQHCQQGDVFQLVLSRRFCQSFVGDDFNVYRALKNINPSPYMFYFDLGSFKIFGSSPEAQLVIQNNISEIHPIAGTYRRTGDDEEDVQKAKALLNDPKEVAEHNMLVDLARNDLSKYCSDVELKISKQTQFYSHVIHLVSKVTGKKKSIHHPFEVLLGTFPAGTLSGAPKYRALELIDEYEIESREFYGGCIGFISHDNQLNHAIMIRTFLSKDNTLYYQAGAGIVVSSDEESELQEINNKVSALKKSIQQAEKFNNITIANK